MQLFPNWNLSVDIEISWHADPVQMSWVTHDFGRNFKLDWLGYFIAPTHINANILHCCIYNSSGNTNSIWTEQDNKPGIGSCDPVSSAQICAWAHSDALPSSVRDPHTPACHLILCHSCHPQPTKKPIQDISNKLNVLFTWDWSYQEIKRIIQFPKIPKIWREHKNTDFRQTFCASSCLSKLTKPNPLDLPFSSVITRILRAGPMKDWTGQGWIQQSICNWYICEIQNVIYLTIFAKQFLQLLIIHVFPKVLDVHIGKFSSTGTKFSLPLFPWFKSSNKSVKDDQ